MQKRIEVSLVKLDELVMMKILKHYKEYIIFSTILCFIYCTLRNKKRPSATCMGISQKTRSWKSPAATPCRRTRTPTGHMRRKWVNVWKAYTVGIYKLI